MFTLVNCFQWYYRVGEFCMPHHAVVETAFVANLRFTAYSPALPFTLDRQRSHPLLVLPQTTTRIPSGTRSC